MNENALLLGLIADHQAGCPVAADRVLRILDERVGWMARKFFYPGADQQDIHQQGLLGVFMGIRSFRMARHRDDPRAFLLFCAKRYMITGLKTHNRFKQRPLSEAVTLELRKTDGSDGEPVTLHEIIAGGDDPADVVLRRERIGRVIRAVREDLSEHERFSLGLAVNGRPYTREETGDKSFENGVDRARRKLREAV